MADKLTEWFDAYNTANPDATPMQIFQAGVTQAAVSMRQRAMDAVKGSTKAANETRNAIGQLSDIPQ